MTHWRAVASVVLVASLAACVGNMEVPEDHYYRLPEAFPAPAPAQPLLKGAVAVAPVEADGLRRERSILYIHADRPLEIKRYYYHYWSDSPPSLIQRHLAQYLRDANLASTVTLYQPSAEAGTLVRGRLLRFERLNGESTQVLVRMELGLSDRTRRRMLWSEEYEAVAEPEGPAMHDTAAAFGNALVQVYSSFLLDMQAYIAANPDSP